MLSVRISLCEESLLRSLKVTREMSNLNVNLLNKEK